MGTWCSGRYGASAASQGEPSTMQPDFQRRFTYSERFGGFLCAQLLKVTEHEGCPQGVRKE